MRNQLLNFGALLVGAALTLSSCTKNNTEGELAYQVKPSNFSASVGTTAAASGLVVNVNSNSSLTWNSGYVNLHQVKLEAKKDKNELEFKSTNLPTIDLAHLSTVFGKVTVPDGTYDEVEVKLVLQKSSANIPLFLKGVYTEASGTKVPVEFSLNEDLELKAEAHNLTVSAGTDYIALLNVQLNKFMNGVTAADLGNTTRGANNTIFINSTTNVTLYNKLKANIQAFAKTEFEKD